MSRKVSKKKPLQSRHPNIFTHLLLKYVAWAQSHRGTLILNYIVITAAALFVFSGKFYELLQLLFGG